MKTSPPLAESRSAPTAGPWEAIGAIVRGGNPLLAIADFRMDRGMGQLPRAEDSANAALAAAAPDLAAALRDLMPLMAECDCTDSDRKDYLCPCRSARAALAKAGL